jgi:hypothetical protein
MLEKPLTYFRQRQLAVGESPTILTMNLETKLQTRAQFIGLYVKHHGTALEHCMCNMTRPTALEEYISKESATYNRFMRRAEWVDENKYIGKMYENARSHGVVPPTMTFETFRTEVYEKAPIHHLIYERVYR